MQEGSVKKKRRQKMETVYDKIKTILEQNGKKSILSMSSINEAKTINDDARADPMALS